MYIFLLWILYETCTILRADSKVECTINACFNRTANCYSRSIALAFRKSNISPEWKVVRPISPYVVPYKCAFQKRISSGIVFTGGRAQSGGLVAKLPVHGAIYISWFSYSSGSAALEICKRARSRDAICIYSYWDSNVAEINRGSVKGLP